MLTPPERLAERSLTVPVIEAAHRPSQQGHSVTFTAKAAWARGERDQAAWDEASAA